MRQHAAVTCLTRLTGLADRRACVRSRASSPRKRRRHVSCRSSRRSPTCWSPSVRGRSCIAVSSYDDDPAGQGVAARRCVARSGCRAHPLVAPGLGAGLRESAGSEDAARACVDPGVRISPWRVDARDGHDARLGETRRPRRGSRAPGRRASNGASPWSKTELPARKNRARCWSSGASAGRSAASTSVAGAGFSTTCSTAAGGVNVFADVATESVQASSELILTRAPEVIIELRTTTRFRTARSAQEIESWNALSSVPAVREPSRASSGWQVAERAGPARRRRRRANGARPSSGTLQVNASANEDPSELVHREGFRMDAPRAAPAISWRRRRSPHDRQ